ncbi:MAG TPA: 4Fe-4S binding protein [Candidatus Binatia bacterium]|nr:4Fe-4S binding protein [Candidatus Binatia bacterium]
MQRVSERKCGRMLLIQTSLVLLSLFLLNTTIASAHPTIDTDTKLPAIAAEHSDHGTPDVAGHDHPGNGDAEHRDSQAAARHDANGHRDQSGHAAVDLNRKRIANFLILLVALTGGLAVLWISRRTIPESIPSTRTFDLLTLKPVAKIVRLKYFRSSLQLINVAVFLNIVYFGFFGTQNPTLSFTYSVTWYFWWPIFFLLMLFFGRLWCMICPFAAMADWVQKLVNFNKTFPKKLRNLWITVVLFLTLHFAYIWWISGSPSMTALAVLLGFIIPAIVVGIIYKRRSYCQYVCPLGGLLTVFSLFAPIQLSNRSNEVCKKCLTKDCYRGNELGRGCPVSQVVTNIKRTGECHLCLECVKTCRNNNVALKVRSFGTDLWNSTKRTFDESTVGVLMVGLVVTKTAVMLEPWNDLVSWFAHTFKFDPAFAANLLFVSLTFLFPLTLTAISIWTIRSVLQRSEAGFWDLYKVWGYMLVPVALALQIAHELDHLINEGPYALAAIGILLAPAVPAFQELAAARATPWLSSELLFLLRIVLPIAGLLFTLFIGYRMATYIYRKPNIVKATLIPMYALAVIFTMVSTYLMGLPMLGHSH